MSATDAVSRPVLLSIRALSICLSSAAEEMVVLDRLKMAKILPGLRASARPRDMLGRVQVLLLAFALANLVGALVVTAASTRSPLFVYLVGLAASPALAAAWISVYRRRDFSRTADITVIAATCAFAIAVDSRWNDDVIAIVTAAVFFGSAYGSTRQVLVRTALLSAVAIGLGLTDPTSFTMAVGFVVGFFVVACLMHGMVSSIDRYEKTARREQVLAATGLDLVAAGDLEAIVAATVEGAHALCAGIPDARLSLAIGDTSDIPPPRYKVLGSLGNRAGEISTAVFEVGQLAPMGQELADQRMFRAPNPDAADGVDPTETEGARLIPGEVLVTRISVSGAARGVLIVESPDPVPDELPGAIRALATQASLAISRIDLQQVAAERESSERFQALIQSSSDIISIVTASGCVTYQSPSVQQIFGYDPGDLFGTAVGLLLHPDDAERVIADFRQVVAEPGLSRICECRLRHFDGSWRHTETRMTNLLDVAAVNGVVLNTRDVTERHTLEAELRHQAFHDSLTGLANRALFSNRVQHSLVAAQRDSGTIAVLYCDLNGLKRVNDSLGYGAGDAALLIIAERLRSCVRGQDTVARMGGNEFAILLDRLSSPTDATIAMERIMALLRQQIQLPGAQVELQPHIGIAVTMAGEESAEDLLGNAAVAMHQARRYEGGYALFDPEMHAEAIRRIEVESQLRVAIDKNQFLLYYQPTIDLQTGRLTGVEALVRWQHPHRGIVPPMEFIPLAEESGLIVPLGQWAIQEACRQVRIWQKEIPADEPIALNVNLSARQLRHPNIVRDVADALDDSGLPPSRLILEITESVLMIDTAATLNRLFQLKSLGVRLAIDDFGTGYSSFAYLRRFPIDILKIDKSFVDGVATEPTSSALVDAMIRIGKTLSLETVAEGVEKVEQADRLRALQCDIGQGYLFSRPLPSDAISTFLRERSPGGERHERAPGGAEHEHAA
jgi:diguanylate cyclase (GGDEF)-like protein/PAS domain S-box-containing protein